MIDEIKKNLLSLKVDIENWGGSFPEIHSEATLQYFSEHLYESSAFPDHVIAIANFIEHVSVSAGDNETAKLAQEIIAIAQRKDAKNEQDWDDYNKALAEEHWESMSEYSPTDLDSRLGLGFGGAKMNKLICKLGYQINEDGGWVATDKAEGFCRQEYSKGAQKKPYIRWYKSFYEKLKGDVDSILEK